MRKLLKLLALIVAIFIRCKLQVLGTQMMKTSVIKFSKDVHYCMMRWICPYPCFLCMIPSSSSGQQLQSCVQVIIQIREHIQGKKMMLSPQSGSPYSPVSSSLGKGNRTMSPGDSGRDRPFHPQHRTPPVQTDQENVPRWPDPNPAKARASAPYHLFGRISERVHQREHESHSSTTDTLGTAGQGIRSQSCSWNHPSQL